MAFTWLLDSTNWDLSITDGKLRTTYGADEVKQRILVTLWHYWEEYFLHVPAGVPWYELILGSKNKRMVEALLRDAILGVPGVISIIRFQIQPAVSGSLRDFAIYADVEVLGGQTVVVFSTSPANIIVNTVKGAMQYDDSSGDFMIYEDGTIMGYERRTR